MLDESDSSLTPHSDVRSGVCGGNLLWDSVLLVLQVSSNTRGGWHVLHQEGIDGVQDGIVPGVVPRLL